MYYFDQDFVRIMRWEKMKNANKKIINPDSKQKIRNQEKVLKKWFAKRDGSEQREESEDDQKKMEQKTKNHNDY